TTSFLLRPPTGVTSLTPQVLAFTSAMVPSRVSYRDVSLSRVTLVSVRATPTDRVAPPTPRVGGATVSAPRGGRLRQRLGHRRYRRPHPHHGVHTQPVGASPRYWSRSSPRRRRSRSP